MQANAHSLYSEYPHKWLLHFSGGIIRANTKCRARFDTKTTKIPSHNATMREILRPIMSGQTPTFEWKFLIIPISVSGNS